MDRSPSANESALERATVRVDPRRELADAGRDPRRSHASVSPLERLAAHPLARTAPECTRRDALAIGAMLGFGALLTACAPRALVGRPAPEWTDESDPALGPMAASDPFTERAPQPAPRQVGVTNPIAPAALPYARPRWMWTRAQPDYGNINHMLPVTALTIHHDGLTDLIEATDARSSAQRLERYRLGHRARGWADIGYHLVIDRGGTVWQGRSIRWQGAHVKDHNEGNIGVLVMGNFEIQRPTEAQLRSLDRVVHDLMWVYGIAPDAVCTHREWPGAQTLCPGRNLQVRVDELRGNLASA